MRRTLQRALHEMAFDPVIGRLAASMPPERLGAIARELATHDPFGEVKALTKALRLASDGAPVHVAEAIEHQLWCAFREASWRTAPVEHRPLSSTVEGARFAQETRGHATMLVAPMTMALCDAVQALRALLPDRKLVLYGEGVGKDDLGQDAADIAVAGDGLAAVRTIDAALEDGGVLCTYPDFVYGGHAAVSMSLFGVTRPLSSAFVALAIRHEAWLLPICVTRRDDGLHVCAEEATRIDCGGQVPRGNDKVTAQDAVAKSIAAMLQVAIGKAAAQWLLLSTLTFESPQMAAPDTAR